MQFRTAIPLCVLLFYPASLPASGANPSSDQPKPQDKREPRSSKSSSAAVLTGCIDQRESHYVITNEKTLNPVARLEAAGFPDESFAKYLGQKVTIKGEQKMEGERKMFRVRSITVVSEVCSPPQQQ